MLQCFGSRRRNRHQWSENDSLLDDEPQIISNPFFLDSGKDKHIESNSRLKPY